MADYERMNELVRRCGVTRERRRGAYGWYRMWYERGTEYAGAPARYNKLKPSIKLTTSYLYAPDSARFSLWLPTRFRQAWQEQARVARDEFEAVWRDSGADVLFANVVKWSLVYGGALIKWIPTRNQGPMPAYVYPGDFGVLREEVPSLDKQEVFCHWFYMSVGEVARLARGHQDEASIIKWARDSAVVGPANRQFPPMIQQMILPHMAAGQPSGIQTMQGLDYPESQEPLVELCEVWERSEFDHKPRRGKAIRFDDYWVTTMCNQYPLFERRNPVLPWLPNEIGPDMPAEQPFTMVSSSQDLDYFWGRSDIQDLLQLQNWRETRMNQLDGLFEMQARPPKWSSGLGVSEEKLRALQTPGGVVAAMPNTKIESIKIEMPDDPWALIKELDSMYAEALGIPPILAGEMQAGLRAGSQVGAMANISVGRLREKALFIEDACEVAATKLWRLMQRHDPTEYGTREGGQFLFAQMPCESKVKVDAHSSSPVYMDQIIQRAQMALAAKAISLPDYIRLLDMPDGPNLEEKAKVLQESQAQMAQKMLAIEEIKARRKGR